MIKKYVVAPDGMASEHPGVPGFLVPDGYTCIDFDTNETQIAFLQHGYLPKFIDGEFGWQLTYVFDQDTFDNAKLFSIEATKEEVAKFNAYFLDKYSEYERESFPYKLEVAEKIKASLGDMSVVNLDHLEFADTEILMRDEGETREVWADKVIAKAKALKLMSAKASGLRAKSERLINASTSVELLVGNLIVLRQEADMIKTEYGIPLHDW